MKKIISILSLLFLLTACASYQLANKEKDSHAKEFKAPLAKSKIYVYRSEVLGAAIGMKVYIDGKYMAKTGPYTFIMTEVSPGPHVITSHAENRDLIRLQTEPGKIYYVWQEVHLGFLIMRTELHVVTDEADAQKEIRQCSLIEATPEDLAKEVRSASNNP